MVGITNQGPGALSRRVGVAPGGAILELVVKIAGRWLGSGRVCAPARPFDEVVGTAHAMRRSGVAVMMLGKRREWIVSGVGWIAKEKSASPTFLAGVHGWPG